MPWWMVRGRAPVPTVVEARCNGRHQHGARGSHREANFMGAGCSRPLVDELVACWVDWLVDRRSS